MATYIYQYPNWTHFTWNNEAVATLLGNVRFLQGKLIGQMNALGFQAQNEAALKTLTLDVVKSSEIEGEILDYQQVRSSVATKLGLDVAGLKPPNRNVDGVVEMTLDATQNCLQPLTHERLFNWHAALFPTGRSGMYTIEVGQYRMGNMQVVSGSLGREKIHYQAPHPDTLQQEMDAFLQWANQHNQNDPVLKAAVAHLWFVIIHPFDDGNGRIARAIADLMLARADQANRRFYSLSNQILNERKQYYDVLQKTQHGTSDITDWIVWFLTCLQHTLLDSQDILAKVLRKNEFWQAHQHTQLNTRQQLIINKLLDGFNGKLQSSKWAKINKCSTDTALRDINDLINKNILKIDNAGGRNTNYVLVEW